MLSCKFDVGQSAGSPMGADSETVAPPVQQWV